MPPFSVNASGAGVAAAGKDSPTTAAAITVLGGPGDLLGQIYDDQLGVLYNIYRSATTGAVGIYLHLNCCFCLKYS